jgi:hypothetical protein
MSKITYLGSIFESSIGHWIILPGPTHPGSTEMKEYLLAYCNNHRASGSPVWFFILFYVSFWDRVSLCSPAALELAIFPSHIPKYWWGRLEIGKVWGSCSLPDDGPNHPHLAGNYPCPSPFSSLLGGNILGLPSQGVKQILKVTEKEKHTLSVSGFYLCQLCPLLLFPFPHLAEQVTPLF